MTGLASLSHPAGLLAAWEQAALAPAAARGAVLVRHGGLAEDMESALGLPVGQIGVLAGQLYAEEFGDALEALVPCAGCGEVLDVNLPLAALRAVSARPESRVPTPDGVELTVRPLTTRDLLVAGRAADPAAVLLSRCVFDPTGAPVDPADLTPDVVARVDAAAERLAGAAAAVVRTECPDCGAEALVPVDMGALLWQRVASAAAALIAEVATLASAFGWREADVLELSPVRRGMYLRLAGGGAA
ncbi:hypothetical protein ABT143_23875 [Streptomyces sp. NPDC002033]|uniref:hypothetical protein n=1 Tax=unclassified Streptomyces TaxID=2593676 RepID=UPI00332021EB